MEIKGATSWPQGSRAESTASTRRSTESGRLVLVDRVVADAGLAQSIPLQVEALGTVRLRYPRVADQHWRLQNDRFCDT